MPLGELGIKRKKEETQIRFFLIFLFQRFILLSRTSFAQVDEQLGIKVEEETRIRSFIVGDGIEDKSTTTFSTQRAYTFQTEATFRDK